MHLFKIVTDRNFLHKPCLPVDLPLTQEDHETLLKMIQYLKDSQNPEISEKYNITPGVGLAANQIGLNKRMLVVYLENDDGSITQYALVNPTIVAYSIQECYLEGGEGCLSVKKKVGGYVYRANKITVKAYSALDKKEITIKARGYLSIVLQHEIDHLNGILYVDRIDKKNPYLIKDNSIAI